MIKACLLFLLFSGALSFGLWGIYPLMSWLTSIFGAVLLMKIAGGMMFFGFVGFVVCLCMFATVEV